MSFSTLPDNIQLQIISYLPYDEISRCRAVSRSFNLFSKKLLTTGFFTMMKHHVKVITHVRNKMITSHLFGPLPCSLTRHYHILEELEVSLKKLVEVYFMCLDRKYCYFIPGLILDEITVLFTMIRISNNPPPPWVALSRLNNLIKMATTHFSKFVLPDLKWLAMRETLFNYNREVNTISHQITVIERNLDKMVKRHSRLNVLPISKRRKVLQYERDERFFATNIVFVNDHLKELSRMVDLVAQCLTSDMEVVPQGEPVAGPSTSNGGGSGSSFRRGSNDSSSDEE